jgi:transcriptional regulator with XRE-family HTH domain
LRKAAGLTQEEVSRRTRITLNAYSEIERGVTRDPHLSSLKQIAGAIGVELTDLLAERSSTPAGKAEASAGVGAPELSELLDRLGARTKNLVDPNLVKDLEGASDATVNRTVRETRRELGLLLPELQRLGNELKPGADGYMAYNKAHSLASQRVLALKFFLRTRNEPEPSEDAIALQGLADELIGAGR